MIDIKVKQNEENILKLLFSARINYNKASKLNNYLWLLSIITGIFSVTNYFDISSENNSIILLVLVIIGIILHYFIKQNTKKGAETKKLIDEILFQFPTEFSPSSILKIQEGALKIQEKYPKEYNIQIKNRGDSDARGVKDWYEPKETTDFNKSIFQCQKENIFWDKNLLNIYKKLLMSTIFILFGFLLFDLYNNSLNIVLFHIFGFFNFLSILVRDLQSIKTYFTCSISMDEKVDILGKNNVINELVVLKELQDRINERRLLLLIVPDFFHKMNSKKLHKKWKSLLSFLLSF